VLETLTTQLTALKNLTDGQVHSAVERLVDEKVSPAVKAEFLGRLSRKGETIEEIAAFARALREKSVQPPIDAGWRSQREILDVVGTGGDQAGTFNISTTVAILCAAAGIAVAKHGNRAITSQVGSADVLEALGIKIDQSPTEAAQSLREHGFAFFFAPNYHPAFKHIAPARKLCAERGQRTIFNFLGPLLNPARPTAQLVGVPRPDLCEPIARVLQSLGVRRGIVVCGQAGGSFLDEMSTFGETTIAEFYQDRGFALSKLAYANFPIQPTALGDLKGGDRAANAEVVRRVLCAEERGPKRDAVLLNASAALLAAGSARTLVEGWDLASQVIDDGKAAAKLQELIRSK
jgi:anthranilate phosphoribosyltransferase